ncbi:MAG: hypothetical protein NVSMB6_27010 [Burkholderiaceae bacterium]
MKHFMHKTLFFPASMLLTAGISTAALAESPVSATEPVDQYTMPGVSTGSLVTAEPSASPFASGGEVNSDTLAQLRGGTDIVTNDQKLSGTVGSNIASNVATGGNSITAGAFANVAGIPIVIQNSGANVLIQNATIINLQMQ